MPVALQNLLKSTPVLIEAGAIQAACIDGKSISMKLNRGSHSLLIENISEDEYLLTPVRVGVKKSSEQLILKADSHFRGFTLNGQEAYLLLIIYDKKGQHQFLLTPRYSQKVSLPAARASAAARIELTPADINLYPSSPTSPTAKMELSPSYLDNSPQTKLAAVQSSTASAVSIALPQIKAFGSNSFVQSDTVNGTNCIFQLASRENRSTNASQSLYQYNIIQRDNIKLLLATRFNELCNQPIGGTTARGDAFYSLATLYHILLELDSASSMSTTPLALTARYCKLYAQPEFAALLTQIFDRGSELCLSPAESAMQTESCIRKRQAIHDKLMEPSTRAYMLERICKYLSEQLQIKLNAALDERTNSQEEHELELIKAQSVEGKAIWTFQIK